MIPMNKHFGPYQDHYSKKCMGDGNCLGEEREDHYTFTASWNSTPSNEPKPRLPRQLHGIASYYKHFKALAVSLGEKTNLASLTDIVEQDGFFSPKISVASNIIETRKIFIM